MKTKTFDIVVIGTGVAATSVAHRCRDAGWSVAVVDARRFGGTCQLRGCDPKKVMVGIAGAVDEARRLAGKGVAGHIQVDWSDLIRFKRSFTEGVPEGVEKSFEEAGIETFHGRARFVGESTVEVGDHRLEARRFHIAAGARPAPLPIEGGDLMTTSDEFLDLERLPSEGDHRRAVYPPIPSVVFTLPPLATVGLGEDEARERGVDVEVKCSPTPDWYSSRRLGEEISGYKVLIEKPSGRILGAHLFGHEAGELINLFTMAIRCGLTTADLEGAIFTYPSRASDAQSMT